MEGSVSDTCTFTTYLLYRCPNKIHFTKTLVNFQRGNMLFRNQCYALTLVDKNVKNSHNSSLSLSASGCW